MTSRELAASQPQTSLAPAPTWALMGNNVETALKFSEVLVRSGMLPRGLDTPAKALVVLLKGRELGLAPMVALSQIAVVQGKPTMSAELMLAMMLRAGIKHQWRTDPERENDEAVLWLQRPDGTEHIERFTTEEAKKAGLLGKDSWRNYPTAMLRARCLSKAGRAFAPDALMGVSYTPEELGAEVNEDGEIVSGPASDPRAQAFLETDAARRREKEQAAKPKPKPEPWDEPTAEEQAEVKDAGAEPEEAPTASSLPAGLDEADWELVPEAEEPPPPPPPPAPKRRGRPPKGQPSGELLRDRKKAEAAVEAMAQQGKFLEDGDLHVHGPLVDVLRMQPGLYRISALSDEKLIAAGKWLRGWVQVGGAA